MEHLTKQQIVLLTLLVSFVTSLSTGIVTVSLMDQAPTVTHTVNQIIEKTIQSSPQSAAVGVVSINVEDQVATAVSAVASSTVRIRHAGNGSTVALGLIVSKNGLIMTAKNSIDTTQSYEAVLADGSIVSLTLNTLYPTQASSQTDTSVIFLTPTTNLANGLPVMFTPIRATNTYSVGQKIFSLGYAPQLSLSDGLIEQIGTSTVSTSIAAEAKNMPGSPLFDIQGNIVGIQTDTAFHLIAPLMPASNVL
jgi:hypothetical protein